MKEDLIEVAGVVVDKQPNAFFKVQINNSEHIVLATISGRMRRHRIQDSGGRPGRCRNVALRFNERKNYLSS